MLRRLRKLTTATLTALIIVSASFFYPSKTALAGVYDSDRQAHLVVGFQSVFLMERAFRKKFDLNKKESVLLANTIGLSFALAKEIFLDPSFSGADMEMGGAGALLATLLFLGMNEKSYELEAEGSFFNFRPSEKAPATPPASNMLLGQTTVWIKKFIGLHVFSGGADNGNPDDSGKRLLYGAGLRIPFFPFIKRKLFSTWIGIDYGRILFATVGRQVPYRQYDNTLFFSSGLRIQATKRISYFR